MYVGQREIAEEIVSDVMVKLWTMGERLLDIANLNIYLYIAVKNTAVNYLIKNKRYSSWDIDKISPYNGIIAEDTPESLVLEEELKDRVKNAISRLPPKCQMVYQLIRIDGLTYKEVAEIMQISEHTVDRHLHIAVRKLAEALRDYLKT